MKILFFGDIVGKIGREAVKQVLPDLKAVHSPDLIIANAENLAHGKGVTFDTLNELLGSGVDFFTSGNHIWNKSEVFDVFLDHNLKDKLIRPANYPDDLPGQGSKILTVGTKKVLVINLLGRIYGSVLVDDPFRKFDQILADHASEKPEVVLVDFHADATSEKNAFGWYADGRATAVWGTHTHVPTRDERILLDGTAYITDVGMCGYRDGVIGIGREEVLKNFLTQLPVKHEIPEKGPAVVNAILVETKENSASSITHLQRSVNIA